ncbi:UNVERIFIED_CONTAM: hypothetical protein FKN15_046441 [Acipenser sinensis]
MLNGSLSTPMSEINLTKATSECLYANILERRVFKSGYRNKHDIRMTGCASRLPGAMEMLHQPLLVSN